MTIYDLLGIESDATLDEIRIAYQQKLKEVDMLRHMDEYQALREAYNQAVKNSHEASADTVKKISVETTTSKKSDITLTNESPKAPENKKTAPSLNTTDSFEKSFLLFLSQKNYYDDFSIWELFLSPFLREPSQASLIKTTIQSFLITHHMLLQDNVRLQLIHLLDLQEEDFQSEAEQTTFRQRIQEKNYLDFSFYLQLPPASRDSYFKNRYLLFLFLQDMDEAQELDATTLNELKHATFKDDDLYYLLGVYTLVVPHRFTTKESRALFSHIQTDKYSHDVAIYERYLSLLDNYKAPMISNVDIVGLSWASDPVKTVLMRQLKEIRRLVGKNSTEIPYKIPKTVNQPIGNKPTSWWKFVAGAVLIFTFIFAMFGMMGETNPMDNFYVDEFDEEGYTYDDIEFLKSTRVSNVKLNNSVYTWLIYDDEIETDYSFISEKSLTSLEQFKSNNQDALDELDIMDLFQDINETHDLTNQDTVITYSQFKDNPNLFLKSITNHENELVSVEQISADKMPENSSLGTLDAVLFFTNDLTNFYDEREAYLINLEELYSTYLTDELYEQLTQLDEEQFSFLTDFAYSKPILIEDNDQIVILLTNFDNEYLFLTLNEDLKIEKLFTDSFESTPDELIKKADKLLPLFDMNNPWAYDLGVDL